MSVKNFTNYNFSNKHGFSGNLAADPTFDETRDGEEYAKMTVYCSKQDNSDDDNKSKRRRGKSDTNKMLNLTVDVRFYDEELLDLVEGELKKGYLVNFKYDNITFSLAEDEETGELKVKAFATANDFIVRHKPEDKEEKSSRRSRSNDDEARSENTRSRRKK